MEHRPIRFRRVRSPANKQDEQNMRRTLAISEKIFTDGTEGFCMAAGRRVRCPPSPDPCSGAEVPLIADVFAFLKPPCISLGPPFARDDRGLPADRMSLLVSVEPVSSYSRAARSILLGARPFTPLPFVLRGDWGLPFDILNVDTLPWE